MSSEVVQQRISGALAAAATPLRDDGARLDEDAFGPLLEFYAASGLDGVLVLGTTGEGILLSGDERRRAAQLAVAAAGPLRVIVHCGAQTTGETSALTAHAAETGADAVAVIAPPYFALDEDELLEHFAAAAAACAPVPFYLYEYAARSGYAVPVAVVERLRERAPNLVGLKVSDRPFDRVEPYLATGLDVFIGADALIRPGLQRSAAGAVSGVAAAFPEQVSALVRDPTAERAELVDGLRAALSALPFQASVKIALALRGLPVRADVRRPLRPLSAAESASLRRDLERRLGAQALTLTAR
jgi:dihydrodipicolinate synthase/N-acetylneuraminate lyase